MARRPDDTRGALIFQEGKCILGEYYIIAVYDDPAWCTISFSAYELENDATYTYPFTYSEFDALFKFDSELMNPSNTDGRFHWVIERLDFVRDARGQKVLCLAQEPTPEEDDDLVLVDEKPKAQTVAPAYSGGKIDAATRAKLLRELDTQDDQKLHDALVKSEGARKRFLADLHAKRQLEQLKASQRLLRADEERETRLAKLEQIKRLQAEKAAALRAAEEAKKSTMAQLEVLLKQKEAQAVRRLIQEKDEQDRGMGREKDAARQRRKMQERSAQEVAAIEAQRAQQVARKREEQVVKRQLLLLKRNRQLAEKIETECDAQRAAELRRRDEKDAIVRAIWARKSAAKRERERLHEHFLRLEEVRDRMNADREQRRAIAERNHIIALKEAEALERETTLRRREKIHKESLLQWRISAAQRAAAVRDRQRKNSRRELRIAEREDVRTRRLRESQFLDTIRTARSLSPTMGRGDGEDEEEYEGEERSASQPPPQLPAESEAFQRTFEQQERLRRQAEREEKRRLEEQKLAKLQHLGPKDPNAVEVTRIREWKASEEAKRARAEEARLARELAQERLAQEAVERCLSRERRWELLEEQRRERSLERERRRAEATLLRSRNLPIGTALPVGLIF